MGNKLKISLGVILTLVFLLGFMAGANGNKIVKNAEGQEVYEYLKTFSDVLDIVKKNYVDQVKDRDLIYAGIKGMVESLDPHSSFLTPDMYKDMQTETKGEFGGIGVEITIKDGFPTVITAIEDTPAFKAGLKPADQLIKVDNKPTRNMSLPDVVKLIRGQKGKAVTLTIMREGFNLPRDFQVLRDIITVKSVKYRMLDDKYGYIRITQFQEKTGRDLDAAINELQKSAKGGLKGILLDLRNNPGGLLDQAVEVSDKFINEGLITYIEGRKADEKVKFVAHNKKSDYLGPLVVLVNEGSASGSEIVAGALQDSKRAIIVGMKTFGKGSVQTIIPLGDGSAVRLTTAKYYTPAGRSIQADGINPDIVVDNDVTRKKGDKFTPIKEKDLDKHLEGTKKPEEKKIEDNDPPSLNPDSTAKSDEDDFQLVMGRQILKSWDALRGK
ncbi:MAG: S41 family peptidase [Syntrophorhabdales bacterium]|jgi:carboxyl-terminal processing protease